jgi:hypothetical protein
MTRRLAEDTGDAHAEDEKQYKESLVHSTGKQRVTYPLGKHILLGGENISF